MSYIKQGFTSGQTLKADHLNYIESGIEGKQDKLTAGNGITIENNVISSSNDTRESFNIILYSSAAIFSQATTVLSEDFKGTYVVNVYWDEKEERVGSFILNEQQEHMTMFFDIYNSVNDETSRIRFNFYIDSEGCLEMNFWGSLHSLEYRFEFIPVK